MNCVGRAAVLEAAAGVHVGQDDDLVGRQYLRRLGHEADAAEGDDVGVGRLRLARQIEAVADEVGNVLDFGRLVIMAEDDGVALLAQPVDLDAQVEALEAGIGCVHGVLALIRSVDPPRPVEEARLLAPAGSTNRTATLASIPAARSGKAKVLATSRIAALRAWPVGGRSRAWRISSSWAARRLVSIERPFGIGERHQDAAFRIFLNLVEIDVRARDFKGRQRDGQGAGRLVPGEAAAIEARRDRRCSGPRRA